MNVFLSGPPGSAASGERRSRPGSHDSSPGKNKRAFCIEGPAAHRKDRPTVRGAEVHECPRAGLGGELAFESSPQTVVEKERRTLVPGCSTRDTSRRPSQAVRRELCEEAIRLATLLAEHPVGAIPETFALLALMNLHAARLTARLDGLGGLVLLEEQDRSLWDQERMRIRAEWLQRAASGEVFTRFHAEAGIAAEHCFAPSFAETRWSEIADLYAMLERISPSPLHTMHRAVAVAEWQGPQRGSPSCRALRRRRGSPISTSGCDRRGAASAGRRSRGRPPAQREGTRLGARGGGAGASPPPACRVRVAWRRPCRLPVNRRTSGGARVGRPGRQGTSRATAAGRSRRSRARQGPAP